MDDSEEVIALSAPNTEDFGSAQLDAAAGDVFITFQVYNCDGICIPLASAISFLNQLAREQLEDLGGGGGGGKRRLRSNSEVLDTSGNELYTSRSRKGRQKQRDYDTLEQFAAGAAHFYLPTMEDLAHIPSPAHVIAPDWSKEAATLPLVPAELPERVPPYWDCNPRRSGQFAFTVTSIPYTTFMDQIGIAHKQGVAVCVELEVANRPLFYATYTGVTGESRGYFRNGITLSRSAGFNPGDSLRMHYKGYCTLKCGKKVHCLRVEKLSSSSSHVARTTRTTAATAATPEWAGEAAQLPIVKVSTPFEPWGTRVVMGNPFNLQVKGFEIFLEQIGEVSLNDPDIYVELMFESHQIFFTSIHCYFRDNGRAPRGDVKRANDMRSKFKLTNDMILKLKYLGHRQLASGKKVHCLSVEKILITPENREEIYTFVGRKGKHAITDSKGRFKRKKRGGVGSKEEQQQPEEKRLRRKQRAPIVSKKRAAPLSSDDKPSNLKTPTPSRYVNAPAWVQKAVKVEQNNNTADAGASGSRQQEPNTVPEHYEIEEDLVDLVVDALLNRSDLDQHLVCKYLPIFGRLPRETREIDGKFILRLSAGRTGSGLQVFLEAAINQH